MINKEDTSTTRGSHWFHNPWAFVFQKLSCEKGRTKRTQRIHLLLVNNSYYGDKRSQQEISTMLYRTLPTCFSEVFRLLIWQLVFGWLKWWTILCSMVLTASAYQHQCSQLENLGTFILEPLSTVYKSCNGHGKSSALWTTMKKV